MKKNSAYISKGTYGMLTYMYVLGISYGMFSGLVIPVLDSVKQFQLSTLTLSLSIQVLSDKHALCFRKYPYSSHDRHLPSAF